MSLQPEVPCFGMLTCPSKDGFGRSGNLKAGSHHFFRIDISQVNLGKITAGN